MGRINITFLDHHGFTSRVAVDVPNATGANLTDLLNDANPLQAGGLAAGFAAVSNCVIQKVELVAAVNKGTTIPPTDQYAERQHGFIVMYSDNVTGAKYHVTVPGQVNGLISDVGGGISITQPLMTDFVSAFNNSVYSPDGNPVTVTGARVVGRSN